MATSTARIEANRRNAARSTGPKTAEGKAASRLNAFRHGMAGTGDLLGPREDAQIVAERAAAFARELGAVGATGAVLTHRAAVLSVRLERVAEDQAAAVREAERQARVDFDADRVEAIEELLAAASVPGDDPGEALEALEGCPDGLAGLIRAWRGVRDRLAAGDAAAAEMAARWLGTNDEGDDLRAGVEAELGRLCGRAGSMGAEARAIERERDDVARAARLDPGPTVLLARRYEAAAERGMLQAIRAVADINRRAGRDAASPGPVASAPPSAASTGMPPMPGNRGDLRAAAEPLASFRAGRGEPLGSFRAGVAPTAGVPSPTANQGATADVAGPEARRRPDYRQLAAARR